MNAKQKVIYELMDWVLKFIEVAQGREAHSHSEEGDHRG